MGSPARTLAAMVMLTAGMSSFAAAEEFKFDANEFEEDLRILRLRRAEGGRAGWDGTPAYRAVSG